MAVAPEEGRDPHSIPTQPPKPMRYSTARGHIIRWVADAAPIYHATAIKIADGPCAIRLVVTHKTAGGTVNSKTELVDLVWCGVGAVGAGEPNMLAIDSDASTAAPNVNGVVTGAVAGSALAAHSVSCVDLVAAASGTLLYIYQGASGDDSLYILNKLTPAAEADEVVVSVFTQGTDTDAIQTTVLN